MVRDRVRVGVRVRVRVRVSVSGGDHFPFGVEPQRRSGERDVEAWACALVRWLIRARGRRTVDRDTERTPPLPRADLVRGRGRVGVGVGVRVGV